MFLFVYSLLESKEEAAYSIVFEIVLEKSTHFEISIAHPQFMISDFELAIINTVKSHFGNIVKGCLFHLCQNVFRRIQAEGLQQQYNDKHDRSLKRLK